MLVSTAPPQLGTTLKPLTTASQSLLKPPTNASQRLPTPPSKASQSLSKPPSEASHSTSNEDKNNEDSSYIKVQLPPLPPPAPAAPLSLAQLHSSPPLKPLSNEIQSSTMGFIRGLMRRPQAALGYYKAHQDRNSQLARKLQHGSKLRLKK